MNRRSGQRVLLPLALTLASALAACGGSAAMPTEPAGNLTPPPAQEAPAAVTDRPSGDAAEIAPADVTCATLLPADELEGIALLGTAPTDTDESRYPGAVDCSWTYTAPDAASEDFFQVLVDANPDNATIWSAMAGAEADGDVQEPIAIDGIGDESYTWVGQGDYRKLYVRRGDRTLIVRGPSTVLVFANESSMIDFADRLFGRF